MQIEENDENNGEKQNKMDILNLTNKNNAYNIKKIPMKLRRNLVFIHL